MRLPVCFVPTITRCRLSVCLIGLQCGLVPLSCAGSQVQRAARKLCTSFPASSAHLGRCAKLTLFDLCRLQPTCSSMQTSKRPTLHDHRQPASSGGGSSSCCELQRSLRAAGSAPCQGSPRPPASSWRPMESALRRA